MLPRDTEGIRIMKKVAIESPLAGDFERNIRYARLCAIDRVRRGEAPYASHLFFTQFLDDRVANDRAFGIAAGLAWGADAHLVALYVDFGLSNGMIMAREHWHEKGKPIEARTLPPELWKLMGAKVIEATPGIETVSYNLIQEQENAIRDHKEALSRVRCFSPGEFDPDD